MWCLAVRSLAVLLLLGAVSSAETLDDPDKLDKPDKKRRKLEPPTISGYMQMFYRYAWETGSDGLVDYDNFRVQRVRIGVSGKVWPWISYDVEVNPRAPEVAGVLRDAYITLRFIPRHRVRLGQQKTQFGYENRESSSRLFAVNRTEVSDNLSRGPNLRDIGIGLLGSLPLGGGLRIEDAVTLTNGTGLNVQADDTDMKTVWGRLGVRYKFDGSWVRLGGSGGIGDFVNPGDSNLNPTDDFLVKFKRVGADAEIDLPWAFLSAEYVWGEDEAEGETIKPKGYYVNLVGRTPWNLGPIVRYDVLEIPDEDFRRWTFGAYYGLAEDAVRVMVNYEYRGVKDDVRGDDKLFLWTQVRF